MGGSLGLVVIGGDSCSKGRGFKSQHCILHGHFSYCNVCLKRRKFTEKEAGNGPYFLKKAFPQVDTFSMQMSPNLTKPAEMWQILNCLLSVPRVHFRHQQKHFTQYFLATPPRGFMLQSKEGSSNINLAANFAIQQ